MFSTAPPPRLSGLDGRSAFPSSATPAESHLPHCRDSSAEQSLTPGTLPGPRLRTLGPAPRSPTGFVQRGSALGAGLSPEAAPGSAPCRSERPPTALRAPRRGRAAPPERRTVRGRTGSNRTPLRRCPERSAPLLGASRRPRAKSVPARPIRAGRGPDRGGRGRGVRSRRRGPPGADLHKV